MKKYKDIIIINLLMLLIGVFFYQLLGKKTEVLTAFFVTGISISFGIRQNKIENDRMFKELFTNFNDKYDKKFNNCLNQIENKTKNNSDYKLTNEEEELVIDYLNLCAEEYLWFSKGRIDDKVWEAWENGIKHYLQIGPINKCVIREIDQKDSYYGLFDRLKLR